MKAGWLATDPPSQTAFLDAVWRLGKQRSDEASQALYEQIKRDYIRLFPGASPDQYELAMNVIAQAAGI